MNKIIKTINKIDHRVRKEIIKKHPLFSTNVDQYLKWTPQIFPLFFRSVGLKTTKTVREQAILFLVSQTVLNSITRPLKYLVDKRRPGPPFKANSFPSNHSATSFVGAEIIRKELKENYPVGCYGGYAAAIATGTLRLYKNKHWLSDVVAGAAIGFIAATLTYHIINKKPEQLNSPSTTT